MGKIMLQRPARRSREPIGFWSLDLQSNILTFDDSTAAYFGVDPREAKAGIAREDIWSHIHPEDLKGLRSRVETSISTRGSFAHSYRIQASPASITYVRSIGSCFANDAGDATHMTGIIVDVGGDANHPPHLQVIELLMQASDVSRTSGEVILPRLIDAVLLEAGQCLARSMTVV
jgi:hypothetical protein